MAAAAEKMRRGKLARVPRGALPLKGRGGEAGKGAPRRLLSVSAFTVGGKRWGKGGRGRRWQVAPRCRGRRKRTGSSRWAETARPSWLGLRWGRKKRIKGQALLLFF